MRIVWILLMFFFSIIAMPVYWVIYILLEGNIGKYKTNTKRHV